MSGPGTVVEVDEAFWEEVIRANLTSTMLACKHAIPVMADGGGGAINVTSSLSAIRPVHLTPYSTAKGALITLTAGLAMDHAAQGIRANCIIVGPMYTPSVWSRGMSDELRDRRRRASPMGREGTGWDTAYCAVYLASDEARYVTGVAIPVGRRRTCQQPQPPRPSQLTGRARQATTRPRHSPGGHRARPRRCRARRDRARPRSAPRRSRRPTPRPRGRLHRRRARRAGRRC